MDTPSNPTCISMIAIADSGVNIHPAIQATPTIAPIIMDNEMKANLPDGRTMESTHKATLQLPGIRNLVRQSHISQKYRQPS